MRFGFSLLKLTVTERVVEVLDRAITESLLEQCASSEHVAEMKRKLAEKWLAEVDRTP